MLSLYDSFKVPGVDAVTMYRDDEDPHAFYMVSTRPMVARDESGEPVFTFLLYARDLDRVAPEQRDIEQGYLSLSSRVAVSKAEEDTIRQHLRNRLNGERQRGYRYLTLPVSRVEPTLGYPPVWTDGSVEFVTFNQEMVMLSSGSKEPALVGENLATFSVMLNQAGAELFRQSIEKGIVPTIVLYKLHFLARIPAVSIHIHGNRRDFYEELKRHVIVTQIRTHNGRVVSKSTWPEIGSLREFREKFHSLRIDIDSGDFREGDPGENVTQKLEEMAFRMLETNILPSFFEQGFAPATEDQSKNKWLMEVEKVMAGEIDVRMKRRDVVKRPVNPNAQLGLMLTPAEIKTHTTYLDLSQTAFTELDVKINANVNFAFDPIFALKVFLDYNHTDEIRNVTVARTKEFLFRTGTEVHRFRHILAKAADGTPKDTYKFHSELVYKDTGETIRIPATGEFESRERELVISYRRLGFVKVNLALGAMPDAVRSATVSMRYPGSLLPTASQSFELTVQKPSATFFTYTGSVEPPRPYLYKVVFTLADGQRMELPEEEAAGESLVISNPFEQSMATRFVAQIDPAVVQRIIVDARYRDVANDFRSEFHTELDQNGQTGAWNISLRDPDLRAFEYDERTIFRTGASDFQAARTGRIGTTIPVGPGGIGVLDVSVDVGLLDWAKYARAHVFLDYADRANGVQEQTQMRFDPSNRDQVKTWRVMLRDQTKRAFRYRAQLLGKVAADDREVAEVESAIPFVVIR